MVEVATFIFFLGKRRETSLKSTRVVVVFDDDDDLSSISSSPKRKTERQRDFCLSVVVLRNTFITRRKRG
jgi:hypothetical protein